MKRRLSASIDEDLLAAAERAVAEGHAPSVSALVEEALVARMAQSRRLEAADELFEWIDREWGALTDEQRRDADASIEANTIRVRPTRTSSATVDAAAVDRAA